MPARDGSGITAALAAGLASYVGYALGLSGGWLKVIAIGTILSLAAINIAGLRLGSWLMQWLTALKLGALGLIAILALALRAGSWSHFAPFITQRPVRIRFRWRWPPGSWARSSRLAAGGNPQIGGEARDPSGTLPRALAIGVAIITGSHHDERRLPLSGVTRARDLRETFAAQAGEACSALQAAACSRRCHRGGAR